MRKINSHYLVVAALILVMFSAVSSAAPFDSLYIEGNVGRSNFDSDLHALALQNGFVNTQVTASSDRSYRFVLGYRFAKFFSLEAGYIDFGKTNFLLLLGGIAITCPVNIVCVPQPSYPAGFGRSAVHGPTIAGLFQLPIGKGFSINGKIGFADATIKTSLTDSTGTSLSRASSTSVSTEFGVGICWNVVPKLDLIGGWENFSAVGNSAMTGRTGMYVTSIGLRVRF